MVLFYCTQNQRDKYAETVTYNADMASDHNAQTLETKEESYQLFILLLLFNIAPTF